MNLPGHHQSSPGYQYSALVLAGLAWLAVATSLSPQSCQALVRFDFEQMYFVHPHRQVWDFSVLRHDDAYHIFYHSIPDGPPYAVYGDTIWHATSANLIHWSSPDPVLTAGPAWWDAGAIWAPDVVWDQNQQIWCMAYTGVDSIMVQRACLATSPDLSSWVKSAHNPIFEPDSLAYFWSPTTPWSSFRDPFLFQEQGQWHMLSTTGLRLGGYPGSKQGIIHVATSLDLMNWIDAGVFFAHDGEMPWHDLESSQYLRRGTWHHLFFTEQDLQYEDHPVSHIANLIPAGWSMTDREILDAGWAAEIDAFDPEVDIFSRLAKGRDPLTGIWYISVRFDTLLFVGDGAAPQIQQVHPLDRNWAEHTGSATVANPTFGDNTARRGEASCGLIGNGWFGSKENYQGPLSGHGSVGAAVGDEATGTLVSYPFTITGDFMRLLVGGGYYPESCYVALVDATADTLMLKATGNGGETMTERLWDLRPLRGLTAVIKIVDIETGIMGHINVDEIEEFLDPSSPVFDIGQVPGTDRRLLDLGPRPNPCNPATEIHFALSQPGQCRVEIYNLTGKLVWNSRVHALPAGQHSISWHGKRPDGRSAPTGIYIYKIEVDGQFASSGKLSLVK